MVLLMVALGLLIALPGVLMGVLNPEPWTYHEGVLWEISENFSFGSYSFANFGAGGSLYALAVMLIFVFIISVISIGSSWGFLKIYRGEKTEPGVLFSKFKSGYARCLGGYWWMFLFTYLWTLLFIVPGIVKSYAYRMTPYILADCPNVKAKDALKLSMKMTQGHKGKLFVADLSFIGWLMLGSLTLGILDVVYVAPYMSTTIAGFYTELRDEALRTGAISPEELV